jgi:hypothetical protein
VESNRQAAQRVLRFAAAELFDPGRGAFSDDKGLSLQLDANGVMAEALLLAGQVGGPSESVDLARRVLMTFGGTAHALLGESDDAVPRASDAVYYLRAYAQAVARAPQGDRRR